MKLFRVKLGNSLALLVAFLVLAHPALCSTGAHAATPVFADTLESYRLAPRMDLFEDKSASLKIEDVAGPSAALFQPNSGGREHFGWTKSALWFRVTLANSSGAAKELALWIPDSWIDRIECYTKGVNGWRRMISGDNVPQALRPIKGPVIAFPLVLGARETVTVYLRVFSPEDVVQLSFKLADDRTFEVETGKTHIFTAFWWGIMCTIFAYSLMLYAATKNRSYLFYALTVFAAIIGVGIIKGYGQWLLWPSAGAWVNRTNPIAVEVFYTLCSIFVMSFLSTATAVPRLHKLIAAFVATNAIGIALSLIVPDMTALSVYVVHFPFIYTAIMIAVGAVCVAKRVPAADFFLIAWVCSLAGSSIYVGKILGILGDGFFTNNAGEIGVGAESILFLIAIGYQIRVEREAARMAVAAADASYRGELTRLNEELEMKIGERTAQLEESENRFRRLSDASFEGIIVHDKGIIADVNEMCLRLTGYGREELIGKSVVELLIQPGFREVVIDKIRTNFEEAYEVKGKRKDGVVISVELRGKMADFHGKRFRVAVFRDISAQKEAEKNLREAKETAEAATKLKDQFVSLISHDLRSPLLSIKGMLDMAKAESPEGLVRMGQNGTFDRIAKSAEGLIALTERLLDHSRFRTGNINPEKRFINVRSLVEERIGRISHLASVKNITIRNLLPESMHIYADPDLYGEVIHNILSNAIKFTRGRGEIDILLTGESSVVVRDNGIGIGEKMLPDLFNGDVRTTTYGTDGEKGTGLGLPYSHNIMKAHGGNLTAASMKDAGTEFRITLPAHATIVLVVDDQDVQRAIMKEMLARLKSVQVVEARNGAEALEMLQYIMPAIIVTDIQMPVMDGFELVRRIRDLPKYELVPIMAVTAFAAASRGELREKLFALGADDFIAKPLVEDDFLPVVARYLGIA